MGKLYLLGDLASNFVEVIKPFIVDSGGENAKIAFLIAGGNGWESHIKNYINPLKENGINNISVIVPNENSFTISDEDYHKIKDATGIFVGGGNTANYQKIYCNHKTSKILIEKYNKGIPYAGLSAGAMILAESFLNDESNNNVLNGLGILSNFFIIPHFIEQNGFKSVIDNFEKTNNNFGLGLNNSSCLEIFNENSYKVLGSSPCFVFKRKVENYEFQIYHSDSSFKIEV